MCITIPLRWTRRQWLTSQTLTLAALAPQGVLRRAMLRRPPEVTSSGTTRRMLAPAADRLDPAPWEALARRAVEAAQAAGARYAEARLTRQVTQVFGGSPASLQRTEELVGIGVRALVNGYWGFSASTVFAPDEVARLAQDAVAQAKANAQGIPWTVELSQIPVATGMWTTPIRIDPFAIPLEEKLEWLEYIGQLSFKFGPNVNIWTIAESKGNCFLCFFREERVVATSEGALFTQTRYESKGHVECLIKRTDRVLRIPGLGPAGAGWEFLLDANIPEQFLSGQLRQTYAELQAPAEKHFQVGRYTLVCDGATMARLLEETLGVATQLDRALAYEANARGTSFLDDPLAMVGHAQVATPVVTITANRSAAQELATVKWDDEGVEPTPFTLVKDGVVTDFQTTREQAAWLAPYYEKRGQPVLSHGCAMAESAHATPLQQMPNLALAPSASTVGVADLVADVQKGIFVDGGMILSTDSQQRTGLLVTGDDFHGGHMREIVNGRLGPFLTGGAVLFDGQDLWKHIRAVGGQSTEMVVATSQNTDFNYDVWKMRMAMGQELGKGQPSQLTSRSVRAAAAVFTNQALIDPLRKA